MSPLTDARATQARADEVPSPLVTEERLFQALHAAPNGLSTREAERRLLVHGPNELVRRGGRRWLHEVVTQLVHPLALLLWAASVLAWAAGTPILSAAIVGVVLLNAAFALVQEHQAERAVEALAAYLPAQVGVIRDGRRQVVDARVVVPGDVLLLEEGDGVPADARVSRAACRSTSRRLPASRSP